MNIKKFLEELVVYYTATRQVGHTTVMQDGINEKTIIIVHNVEAGRRFYGGCLKTTSLNQIANNSLRSYKNPIAFDNYALHVLFNEALERINKEGSSIASLHVLFDKALIKINKQESNIAALKRINKQEFSTNSVCLRALEQLGKDEQEMSIANFVYLKTLKLFGKQRPTKTMEFLKSIIENTKQI